MVRARRKKGPSLLGKRSARSRRRQAEPQPTPPTLADAVWGISARSAVVGLATATAFLTSLIFAPISFWPLALVCMTPWLVMVGGSTLAPRVYRYSYLMGLVFFLWNLRWLYAATGWGYLSLTVYLSVYFPFAAIAIRHVVRRRRWPLAIAFPFIWTGCEMLRAVVISGFPWFFLSHSVHKVLTLIQISDVVGAYGVTFMLAAVNGAVADALLARLAPKLSQTEARGLRSRRVGPAFAAALVLIVMVYGQIQLHRDTIKVGPKIAIVQGDFINTIATDVYLGDRWHQRLTAGAIRALNKLYGVSLEPHDHADDQTKFRTYLSMLESAAAQRPDLCLLPETPWIMYLNPEAREFFKLYRASFAALQAYATGKEAVVVTGSASLVPTPYDLLARERRYNSATVFAPDGAEPQRYDKCHLVYFGEVVPFRFGSFRWLYFLLNRWMPFSGPDGSFEYSIFPGESFKTFSMVAPSREKETYRFSIPICYEDVMPYVAREFVGAGSNEKRVDFLLNISNDGWFGRGIQQPQHLAICVFRAVENRVGVVRSVNTGVSAFIQPDGRIHDVVTGESGGRWPGQCGYSVANVGVDTRFSLYTRYGDWFAWGCALVWLAIFLDYWVTRVRELA